jgi:alkaline phosphatase D
MKIDRRRMLALLGLGAASPVAAQPTTPTRAATFQHGVASGDPLQDRVVLWTRITPAAAGASIAYRWSLTPVDRRAGGSKSGRGVTGPERDYTAKVDVAGLTPGREYTFQFEGSGATSPVGRTRTLPSGATKDVVLAVASCSLYPAGHFNAYQAIADLPRVDAVLHLGDYIYEYGGEGSYGMDSAAAGARPHDPPREIVSLADYRRRHAQYKSDPGLQAAHARAPWIVVWDDHETTNDSHTRGAQNHQAETEGDWNARKAVAFKAYYEWMPIREPAAGTGLIEAGQRAFQFGDLASVIMLETRLTARDAQLDYDKDLAVVNGQPDVAGFRAKLADPARRMMGAGQEAWLGAQLADSVRAGRAWQVLGNQVVMARLAAPSPTKELTPAAIAAAPLEAREQLAKLEPLAAMGLPYGLDMWDGYPADRERLYGLIRQAGARPIVVSGDSHCFWVNDLHDDAGRRVACEFGTTGITSPGGGDYVPGVDVGEIFARANEEVVFNDQTAKGFVLLTLTREEARGELMAVSTITSPTFTTRVVKTFRVRPDGAGLSAPTET